MITFQDCKKWFICNVKADPFECDYFQKQLKRKPIKVTLKK